MKYAGFVLLLLGLVGLGWPVAAGSLEGPLGGSAATVLAGVLGLLLTAGGLGALTAAEGGRPGLQESLLLLAAVGTLILGMATFFGVWKGWPAPQTGVVWCAGLLESLAIVGLGLWIFLHGPSSPLVFYPGLLLALADLAWFALILARGAGHA